MAAIKLPPGSRLPAAAPAAPDPAAQARARANHVQARRDVQRDAKNQQLSTLQRSGTDAATKASASSSAAGSDKAAAAAGKPKAAASGASRGASSSAPKAASGDKAAAPKAQAPKAAKGAGGVGPVDRLRTPEAADIDSSSTDQFTGDGTGMLDLRRVLGAVEDGGHDPSAAVDTFDPSLSPVEVERLGNLRAAVHMVRLMDLWKSSGAGRDEVISQAATMLMGFSRPEATRGVVRELDRAPIHSVYPLQLELALVDQVPGLFPNVERGHVVQNKDILAKGERIKARHDCRLHLPSTMKVKAFALLTPGQPGYEFEPVRSGVYRLLIDTPGEWTFALRAEKAGQSLVDTFTVSVRDPGPAELAARREQEPSTQLPAATTEADLAGDDDGWVEEESTRNALNPLSWARAVAQSDED